ncbi:MAG TPA: hypothetical protein VKI19_07075 [Acidimicrobiales bacterium]|nr:hypothetical protein [Acidimicrobiales bacterium]
MTFLELHPIDPHEARFKVIATLFLLSELGMVRYKTTGRDRAPAPGRAGPLPEKRAEGRGSRLVRPPRSC